MSKWQLVSPAGMATGDVLRPAPRPNSLEGKTILLRWNGKHNGDVFLNRIAELIWRNIKGAKVLKGWELAPETAIGSISPRTSREFAARFAALKPDIVIGSTAD